MFHVICTYLIKMSLSALTGLHHHQSVLPKGRSFTGNLGIKVAVLSKGRFSTANSGTKVAVLLGINRCGSFPLLSTPHSLFSTWTDLRRSEKIPGAPTLRWGECIWLTGPSRLHRNSPQRLNVSSIRVFDLIRDPEIPITLALALTGSYRASQILCTATDSCRSQPWLAGPHTDAAPKHSLYYFSSVSE